MGWSFGGLDVFCSRVYSILSTTILFCFLLLFAVFKLAGWPKRATIARGSQWVPKDSATISLNEDQSNNIG